MSMLKVNGKKILLDNKEIRLRGYCIGNWMMMENFMMGFAGTEQLFRRGLKEFAGEDKTDFFIKRLMNNYVEDADIAYLAQLGVNVIRLPFNYRHFEKDTRPYEYSEDGFYYMDKLISLCKKYQIFVFLDMHAAPGYQSMDWHCDNYEGQTHLYTDTGCQDRFVKLWEYIAMRYRDEETVAGYDLLNEPVARGRENADVLNMLYERTVKAIRKIDPEHIIVLRGNYWGINFDSFQEPFDDNLVYACHYYPLPGLHEVHYPSFQSGELLSGRADFSLLDKTAIQAGMKLRDKFMEKYNVPCWVSEFGLWDENPEFSHDKLVLLQDQLDIFESAGHNWTLWSYKDIGNMGLVRPRPDSPWIKFISTSRNLKKKYKCDFDTTVNGHWKMASYIRDFVGDDFGKDTDEVCGMCEDTLSRTLSQIMARYFCRKLAESSMNELALMADSFRFENCIVEKQWEKIVKDALSK